MPKNTGNRGSIESAQFRESRKRGGALDARLRRNRRWWDILTDLLRKAKR